MNLMAVTRINTSFYCMSSIYKPVGNFINTFSVFTNRILISTDIINRKIRRNLASPFRASDRFHHLDKIKQRLICSWPGKCIKWIFCMISLNIRIRTDPFIAYGNITTTFTHPAH